MKKNLDIKPSPMGDKRWEIKYDSCAYGNPENTRDVWLPMAAKNRPTPHKKVNECDH